MIAQAFCVLDESGSPVGREVANQIPTDLRSRSEGDDDDARAAVHSALRADVRARPLKERLAKIREVLAESLRLTAFAAAIVTTLETNATVKPTDAP
jgi:hypothetical protein